jgi:hypothetical protein
VEEAEERSQEVPAPETPLAAAPEPQVESQSVPAEMTEKQSLPVTTRSGREARVPSRFRDFELYELVELNELEAQKSHESEPLGPTYPPSVEEVAEVDRWAKNQVDINSEAKSTKVSSTEGGLPGVIKPSYSDVVKRGVADRTQTLSNCVTQLTQREPVLPPLFPGRRDLNPIRVRRLNTSPLVAEEDQESSSGYRPSSWTNRLCYGRSALVNIVGEMLYDEGECVEDSRTPPTCKCCK